MTETTKPQTAKIYQFPAGRRAGLSMQGESVRHDAGRRGETVQTKQPKFVLGGGCWYHEAAMNEGNLDNAG